MTQKPEAKLAWAWGNRDLSDVRLVIRVGGGSATEIVVDAHSIVLGAGSEFLRTKITQWRTNPTSTTSHAPAASTTPATVPATKRRKGTSSAVREEVKPDTRCLVELVVEDGDELAAAQEAVRYLYFEELSQAAKASPKLLLQLGRLADQYLMPAGVKACLAALEQLPVGSLDTPSISLLLQLCSGFGADASMEQLLQAVCRKVLQDVAQADPKNASSSALQNKVMALLGSVPVVVRTKVLKDTLLNLPFSWISFWAAADALTTDHEDSVVLLLDAWGKQAKFSGHQGLQYTEYYAAVAKAQKEAAELSQHVRMLHVSQAYLHGVIPQMLWFNQEKVQAFAMVRATAVADKAQARHIDSVASIYKLPSTWLKGKSRSTATAASPLASLQLAVPVKKVEQWLEQAQTQKPGWSTSCSSPAAWCAGWQVVLHLQLSKQEAECQVSVTFSCTPALPTTDSPAVALAEPKVGQCLILISGEVACQQANSREYVPIWSMNCAPCIMGRGRSYTFPSVDGSAKDLGKLSHLMVDDEFRFKFDITALE